MRQNFYSEQELMAMPLGKLNRLVLGDGIKDPEEERLINKVMDAKRGFAPMQTMVTLRKDLDIVDQRQEEQWENELARRQAAMRPGTPTQVPIQPQAQIANPTPSMPDPQVISQAEPEPQDVEAAPVLTPEPVIKKTRKPRTKKA